MTILDHFVYETPRPVQEEFLLEIERSWDDYDVFVGIAPTAAGKEALALTVASWAENARYIVPTNVLVDQIVENHPRVTKLKGVATYECIAEAGKRCTANVKNRCRGCPYNADNAAFNRSRVGVTNYHMYAMKIMQDKRTGSMSGARRTLVADEAHNLVPFLADHHSSKLFKHKFYYPDDLTQLGEVAAWAEDYADAKKAIKELHLSLKNDAPKFVLEEVEREWRGGGTLIDGSRCKRGDPVDVPALKLTPIDIRDYPETMWPRGQVTKILLLSATISRKDIEDLGLDKRRVKYLECKSPIAPDSRPVYLDYVGSVSRDNQEEATRNIAAYIRDVLMPKYEGQKGFIHSTYEQAKLLEKTLGNNSRVLFHNEYNKKQVYERFRGSSPKKGMILVASGMYEGVSLDYDAARWQCITKVPWLSLGDAAVKYKSESDPEWYTWQTLKSLIQACGRVCRTPTDFGTTHILDSSVDKLLTDAEEYDLLPTWFSDSLRKGET